MHPLGDQLAFGKIAVDKAAKGLVDAAEPHTPVLVGRIKHRSTPLGMAKHFTVGTRFVGRILPSILVKDGRVNVRVQYCQFLFTKTKRMWSVHGASRWRIIGPTLLLTPHALNVSHHGCPRVTASAPSVAGATRCVANDWRATQRVLPPSESSSRSSAARTGTISATIAQRRSRIRSKAGTNDAPIDAQGCAIRSGG